MSAPVAIAREYSHGTTGESIGTHVLLWCPGCDGVHRVVVADHRGTPPGPVWTWNGDVDHLTIDPSLLVNGGQAHPGKPVCHSFIRDGQWQFLGDCTHALAGQTVDLPPLPNWLVNE